MKKRDIKDITPAQERRNIGTPAGENPEKGRIRHGTQCLTEDCEIEMFEKRRVIGIEITDEDFFTNGEEISTTGGLTGTRVRGGVPAGGAEAGGTAAQPEKPNPSGADK